MFEISLNSCKIITLRTLHFHREAILKFCCIFFFSYAVSSGTKLVVAWGVAAKNE